MTDTEKALNYYRSALLRIQPDFVPSRIYIAKRVYGDGPFRTTFVTEGEHVCHSNTWGALHVQATDGSMLGIKPAEFEPTAWRENA